MEFKSLTGGLLIVVIAGLVYLLSPILMPFLLGALFAYLGDPLVSLFSRWGIPRVVGVAIIFLVVAALIAGALFLMLPLLSHQIVVIAQQVTVGIDWMQSVAIPWLQDRFGLKESIELAGVKQHLAQSLGKSSGAVKAVLSSATHSGQAIIELITNIVLVPVVAFYLMRDWQYLLNRARACFPKEKAERFGAFFEESNDVVAAFFKGQLLVMLALGVIYSLGLYCVGLKLGLIIGIISGLVAVVPYLGFIVGIISASIAALIQFHTFQDVALVWAVYAVGQLIESMVLTPLLVGDKIGLHPVIVIFALLAGGVLFGFLGILLALPIAAVAKVFIVHLMASEEDKRDEVSCS
jgi:predicted PurR-regulated permease PerM